MALAADLRTLALMIGERRETGIPFSRRELASLRDVLHAHADEAAALERASVPEIVRRLAAPPPDCIGAGVVIDLDAMRRAGLL